MDNHSFEPGQRVRTSLQYQYRVIEITTDKLNRKLVICYPLSAPMNILQYFTPDSLVREESTHNKEAVDGDKTTDGEGNGIPEEGAGAEARFKGEEISNKDQPLRVNSCGD